MSSKFAFSILAEARQARRQAPTQSLAFSLTILSSGPANAVPDEFDDLLELIDGNVKLTAFDAQVPDRASCCFSTVLMDSCSLCDRAAGRLCC